MTLKERFGLDGFDLTIHLVVTVALCAIAGGFFSGAAQDTVTTGIVALSAVTLGVRRRFAQRAALSAGDSSRLDSVEQRLEDLEVLHQRVGELEERLDFTERILARYRDQEEVRVGPGGAR